MPSPTGFTEWGYLGALLFLVLMFGWFLSRRDSQWQTFLKEQRESDNKIVTDLVAQVKSLTEQMVALRDDFNEHNTWERTELSKMDITARQVQPEAPRNRRKAGQ